MKRKIFGIAIIAVILSILAYGTLAYFTTQETTHNVITSGGIEIQLLEWADEEKMVEFPEGSIKNVMPSADVIKIVEVENSGPDNAHVRVKVDVEIELVSETDEADISLMTMDFNDTDWTLKDGYYYYNTSLASGEVTEPLFTKVSFSKDMGNIYQNAIATVDVTAYGVQVANNGACPLDAKGWPEANTMNSEQGE